MKIRFTKYYRVKPDGPEYQEGQVVDLLELHDGNKHAAQASAQHFINRQAAVPADGPEPHRPQRHQPAEQPPQGPQTPEQKTQPNRGR
jgi:hypothetical protein